MSLSQNSSSGIGMDTKASSEASSEPTSSNCTRRVSSEDIPGLFKIIAENVQKAQLSLMEEAAQKSKICGLGKRLKPVNFAFIPFLSPDPVAPKTKMFSCQILYGFIKNNPRTVERTQSTLQVDVGWQMHGDTRFGELCITRYRTEIAKRDVTEKTFKIDYMIDLPEYGFPLKRDSYYQFILDEENNCIFIKCVESMGDPHFLWQADAMILFLVLDKKENAVELHGRLEEYQKEARSYGMNDFGIRTNRSCQTMESMEGMRPGKAVQCQTSVEQMKLHKEKVSPEEGKVKTDPESMDLFQNEFSQLSMDDSKGKKVDKKTEGSSMRVLTPVKETVPRNCACSFPEQDKFD